MRRSGKCLNLFSLETEVPSKREREHGCAETHSLPSALSKRQPRLKLTKSTESISSKTDNDSLEVVETLAAEADTIPREDEQLLSMYGSLYLDQATSRKRPRLN
eukprot:CAMPEP_0184697190 /NCGR_PEP_ID=MMETSP0313-20130426/4228_1 /TAXON_ID=2792 /ORGANISM="Porphyridium aerugineum, Strain SAG 1380-2" /LENGTH=103 /DNA_ID=CAMNT_0027155953 /DNA_START=155 /DNA_END=466 /DNA_ORIENTATION=-